MAEREAWIEPTLEPQLYRLPRRLAGVPHVFLLECWMLRQLYQLMRFHLAHPEIAVPGYTRAVIIAPVHGRKKSARHRRAEATQLATREHARRIVTVFWPCMQMLSDSIGSQARELARGQHSTEIEPHTA